MAKYILSQKRYIYIYIWYMLPHSLYYYDTYGAHLPQAHVDLKKERLCYNLL